jgi:GR25 family glycosyltransferase involved in LPS biosynthesis
MMGCFLSPESFFGRKVLKIIVNSESKILVLPDDFRFESGAKMIQSKIPAMSVNFIRLSGSDKRVLRDGHWVS